MNRFHVVQRICKIVVLSAGLLVSLTGCSDDGAGDACALEDQDGIIGGSYTFELTVNDEGFTPVVITAQNSADVTLTFTNSGSGENGFMIDCLPTPNSDGCPTESCFPEASTIAAVPPGQSATVEFRIPEVEGIYTFRTQAGDDTRTGQIVVQ